MHKHKYHFFSNITNEDKSVEAKVKYFFDCLSIAFKFTNKHYDFPCENHKTVITSIYYQIKHNKPNYAKRYIKFYFDFLAKDTNQFQFFDYDTTCLTDLKIYIEGLKKDEIPKFNKYILPIENLLTELNETYFSKCFEKIKNHVCSSEALESKENDHSLIECIYHHTKFIAVEFFLTGASDNDIKYIPRNICNKSVKNFEQTKHLNKIVPNLELYFKNRKLHEQLNEVELIYNLFKSSQTLTFFIKPHYKITNKVDINIFNVHITSDKPNYIVTENFNHHIHNESANLIIDDSTLFANIIVESNHSNTVKLARQKVLIALNTMSNFSENYYTIKFAYYQSNGSSIVPLKNNIVFDNQKLLNATYQYYKIGKNIKDAKIDSFLEKNDLSFITGRDSLKRSELLTNLWFYLESYFGNTNDAVSKTSTYLSEKIKQEFEHSLYNFLDIEYFNFINGMPEFVLEEDRVKFHTNLYSEIGSKLKFFKKTFKHPIITEKLIIFDNGKNTTNTKFQEFIIEYLKQVNIYRNMQVHSLIQNDYFTGSNLNFLLRITNYFRQDLIAKAIENYHVEN